MLGDIITKQFTQKWQTNQNRIQREHETQIALLNVMATNKEMPYILMVLGGAAVGSLPGLMNMAMGGEDENDSDNDTSANFADFIAAGPFAWVLPTIASVKYGDDALEFFGLVTTDGSSTVTENPIDTGGGGIFGFIPNVLKLAGTGLAGFGASVLILKAIFGDEDVASLMSGVGTMADAVIPL